MSKDYQKKFTLYDEHRLQKVAQKSMLCTVLCYQFTWLIYKKWLCPNPNHFLNSVH